MVLYNIKVFSQGWLQSIQPKVFLLSLTIEFCRRKGWIPVQGEEGGEGVRGLQGTAKAGVHYYRCRGNQNIPYLYRFSILIVCSPCNDLVFILQYPMETNTTLYLNTHLLVDFVSWARQSKFYHYCLSCILKTSSGSISKEKLQI